MDELLLLKWLAAVAGTCGLIVWTTCGVLNLYDAAQARRRLARAERDLHRRYTDWP